MRKQAPKKKCFSEESINFVFSLYNYNNFSYMPLMISRLLSDGSLLEIKWWKRASDKKRQNKKAGYYGILKWMN